MHFIGIDLSRTTANYYVTDEAGKRVASGRIELTSATLLDLCRRYNDAKVALETSPVTFRLTRALRAEGVEVFIVNTRTNFLIRRSMQKTDAMDAKTLCEQLREGKLPKRSIHVPTPEVEELRNLLVFRAMLVKARTAASNRGKGLAARNEVYLKAGALSSKRGWEKLEPMTVGWPRTEAEMYRCQRGSFITLETQINALEWQIVELIERFFPLQARLLETIPGIGQLTSAMLLAYLDDASRFDNARQVCSYVGLAPAVRDSGTHKSRLGITKSGNPLLRSYLTQAALTVSNQKETEPLKQWYQEIRKRRGWQKARTALSRKLVVIAYGVLKHQQPFNPLMLQRQA